MRTFKSLAGAIDKAAGRALRGISIFLIALLFLLLIGNVVFRLVPVVSFGWFDEIVELCFAYLVFFGAAALWREKEHFYIDWLPKKFAKSKLGVPLCVIIEIVGLGFFLTLFWFGLGLTLRVDDQSPIFRLPRKLFYACVPTTALIMALYSVRNIVEWLRRPTACP